MHSPYLGHPHALEISGHLGLPLLLIRGPGLLGVCMVYNRLAIMDPFAVLSASFDHRHCAVFGHHVWDPEVLWLERQVSKPGH